MSRIITRRSFVGGLAVGAGGLLSGCDALGESEGFRSILFGAERINMGLQRALTDRNALAREYSAADRSPVFRVNGTRMPNTPGYQDLMANNFADWRLVVDGLVGRPLSLSLDQLVALPRRTQITRHDCVEGWSAIGQWTGVPLKTVLNGAGLRQTARYIVFHCADFFGPNPYYESIDLVDAFHPQTILAYAMNGRRLPVGYGAPLRLRVERQLGYKHAKYVMRIEAVDSLERVGLGKGGYWEDHHGYEWYAGI